MWHTRLPGKILPTTVENVYSNGYLKPLFKTPVEIRRADDFCHKTNDARPAIFSAEKQRVMNINKKWHEKHKMPANPSFEERVKWHLEHRENCSCAPIPEKLLAEMKKRGIKV